MGEIKLDVIERWPELFEELDELQRHAVVQSLAAAWHEGWEPNRDDVADLVDRTRGAIDRAEFMRRARERAAATAGRPSSAGTL